MILTHAQLRQLVYNPELLAELTPPPEEREALREMGLHPFLDDVLAAYVAGQDLDTSADDVHRAAVKALAQGKVEQAHEDLNELFERIQARWDAEDGD